MEATFTNKLRNTYRNTCCVRTTKQTNTNNLGIHAGHNCNLLKQKIFDQLLIKGYHLVSKIDVTNVQDNHRTILEINTLEVDSNISDETFQEKNLKRFEKFAN